MRRRGLAPLEFVLSVPILMFVMALIANFGALASWKVRALTASRQGIWRTRYGRTGGSDPRPAGWPANANISVGQGANLFSDPYSQYTVVRGPFVSAPNGGAGLRVDANLLDVTGTVRTGNSDLTVIPPFLPKLQKVAYHLQHQLAEGNWQFGAMGIPQNVWYRIPYLYPDLKLAVFFNRVPQQRQTWLQATQAILNAPFRAALNPLDRDDEFFAWYGPRVYQYRPPDFHPRVQGCYLPSVNYSSGDPDCQPCLLDSAQVHGQLVLQLIERIQGPRGGGRGGVPDNMANAFIRLYEDQINELQAMQPPPLDQIQALQKKIDALRQFQGTLN